MAEDEQPPMRGGKKSDRDRWFGLEKREDFHKFRRWWHREGKEEQSGRDIASRDEAERIFEEWSHCTRRNVR